MEITQEKIEQILTCTEKLFNHIYWFQQDFGLPPKKNHIGTAINYTDIKVRKEEFIEQLSDTLVSWVYNSETSKRIFEEQLSKVDYGQAASFLRRQAKQKFRQNRPQGQFGELLLFNFIQYFFKAAPLLRKQPITTSTGMERYGADAIHFKMDRDSNVFVLGEAKCYESKYKFNSALDDALHSIATTFENFDKELNLYVYDDFIDPTLLNVAKAYKEGTLPNVRFELVCVVVYNETSKISKDNEKEIKEEIKQIICNRCNSFDKGKFSSLEASLLNRINYIIFPIWELDNLLAEFIKIL